MLLSVRFSLFFLLFALFFTTHLTNHVNAAEVQCVLTPSGLDAPNIKSCDAVPAEDIGPYRANLPTSCPAPSFYDGIHGGGCWECPSGYIRSTNPMLSPEACWAPTTTTYSRAKLEGRYECPKGAFYDFHNGGTCYSCPENAPNRTWDPIWSDTACSASLTGPFARAVNEGKPPLNCPEGSFLDLHDGGTRWSCPEGYIRTGQRVFDNDQACFRASGTRYASGTNSSNPWCGRTWEPGDGTIFYRAHSGRCYQCPTLDGATGDILLMEKDPWRNEAYTVSTMARNQSGDIVQGCLVSTRIKPDLPPPWSLFGSEEDFAALPLKDWEGLGVPDQEPANSGTIVVNAPMPDIRLSSGGSSGASGGSSGGDLALSATVNLSDAIVAEGYQPPSISGDYSSFGALTVQPQGGNLAQGSGDLVYGTGDFKLTLQPGSMIFPKSRRVLPGGNESLLAILDNPRAITDYLKEVARQENKDPRQFVQQQWAQIVKDPANNEHLKALVFVRLAAAIEIPAADRTPEADLLVKGVAEFVRSMRTHAAQENLDMYQKWYQVETLMRQLDYTAKIKNWDDTVDPGPVPPDFTQATHSFLVPTPSGAAAMSNAGRAAIYFATTLGLAGQVAATDIIYPHRYGKHLADQTEDFISQPGFRNFTKNFKHNLRQAIFKRGGGGKLLQRALQQNRSLTKLIKIAGFKEIKHALKATMVASKIFSKANIAATAFTLGLDLAAEGLIVQYTRAWEMEPKLRAALELAQEPVDLGAMSRSNVAELQYWWGLLAEDPSRSAPQVMAKAQEAAKIAAQNNYYPQLAFKFSYKPALDVAMDSDGNIALLQTTGVPFYKTARGQFTQLPGRAQRIAMAKGTDIWVVNSKGIIWRYDRAARRWARGCGGNDPQCGGAQPAKDIGVSDDGTVWALSARGQLLRRDPRTGAWWNSKLEARTGRINRLDGGAITAKGASVIFTDPKYVYSWYGDGTSLKRLAPLPRPVVDVTVDNDGARWALDDSGQMWKMPWNARDWEKVSPLNSRPWRAGSMSAAALPALVADQALFEVVAE